MNLIGKKIITNEKQTGKIVGLYRQKLIVKLDGDPDEKILKKTDVFIQGGIENSGTANKKYIGDLISRMEKSRVYTVAEINEILKKRGITMSRSSLKYWLNNDSLFIKRGPGKYQLKQ